MFSFCVNVRATIVPTCPYYLSKIKINPNLVHLPLKVINDRICGALPRPRLPAFSDQLCAQILRKVYQEILLWTLWLHISSDLLTLMPK